MIANTATETARFGTLAGQMLNDRLKYTRVVHVGAAQYEIQCAACGQAGWEDEARTRKVQFKFQSDAADAARTHAKHCLA